MTVGIVAGVISIAGITGYVGYTLRKNWANPHTAPDVEKSEFTQRLQLKSLKFQCLDAAGIPVVSHIKEDGQRHIPVWGGGEVVVSRS